MQSDGQRAAPLRSVTCWHLCILCHLLYIDISYIISHHTTLGILRHPCYVLYLCILRNLIRYTYCPPLRKLHHLYVWVICWYVLCILRWLDCFLFNLFVCFCVFVEMSLYAYKSCTFSGGLIDLVACLFVVFVCVWVFKECKCLFTNIYEYI